MTTTPIKETPGPNSWPKVERAMVAVRVDQELLGKIDSLALRKHASRSATIRYLLRKGLEAAKTMEPA